MNSPEMNHTQPVDPAQAESEVLSKCHRMMKASDLTDPSWFAKYEDSFPDTAARDEVVELMRTAPDQFSLGVMYGKYLMRQEIAAMTGREFQ